MEKRVSLLGLLINLILAVAKILVGILSKSSAIMAEGLHSGMDVVSSGINYIGIRVSKKPPDIEHPYGHHKTEVLSGFVIAIILFLTALWIIYESVMSFLMPGMVVVGYLSVGVMIFSVIVNEIMARLKIKYGKKYDNISLLSDAVHSRVDVLTSLTILVGLIVSKYFIYADSIMAILIGLYILKESFSLGKTATDSLLDVSAGQDIENKIREIVEKEKIKIQDLKTQKRGSKIFAQIDIILPSNLKVDQASSITKKLQQNLITNIENLDYVAIQIASHEISESYYKGLFGRGFGWQRKGRMYGEAQGPGGYCVCPQCGHRVEHQRGVPCSSLQCPKCKVNLTRKENA